MNILFVSPNYYPHGGGVEKHVRELSRSLVRTGHSVTVLTVKHEVGYLDREDAEGINVLRLEQPRSPHRAAVTWAMLRQIRAFMAADVIHFHDFGTLWGWGLGLYPLLRLLNKRIFLTFHGWEGSVPPKRSVVLKRRLCERLVDANLCIGHFIERWYGTRADAVSYGAVNMPADVGNKGDYALFIGRLEADTGVLMYLEAWRYLRHRYPELRLILCGDGSLRTSIIERLKADGEDRVELRGYVADPTVFLRDARLVFTSGYLGILEAFSFQKPVVAVYDNALKRDYLEMMPQAREMMWIAGTHEEVGVAVQEGLGEQAVEKLKKAYDFASRSSWEALADQYLKLWGRSEGSR